MEKAASILANPRKRALLNRIAYWQQSQPKGAICDCAGDCRWRAVFLNLPALGGRDFLLSSSWEGSEGRNGAVSYVPGTRAFDGGRNWSNWSGGGTRFHYPFQSKVSFKGGCSNYPPHTQTSMTSLYKLLWRLGAIVTFTIPAWRRGWPASSCLERPHMTWLQGSWKKG